MDPPLLPFPSLLPFLLQTEISEIVKRRTAFETALIRKGSNERDWLDYIDYEKRLEQLRKLRYNKLSEWMFTPSVLFVVEARQLILNPAPFLLFPRT